jgi:hypothetical protein
MEITIADLPIRQSSSSTDLCMTVTFRLSSRCYMESGLHDEFPVSEQEVAMPTTRETHHSGKICRFFLFLFFTPQVLYV